jgi:hypothetical protein
VIARGKGHDSALPLFGRELKEAVGRSAQLECAAGLQALALKPDSGASDFAFDERRSLDQSRNSLRGVDDILARDRRLVR